MNRDQNEPRRDFPGSPLQEAYVQSWSGNEDPQAVQHGQKNKLQGRTGGIFQEGRTHAEGSDEQRAVGTIEESEAEKLIELDQAGLVGHGKDFGV